MIGMAADATHVRRLRARGAELDRTSTPLRLGALLSSIDLRPPSVPPSAILIVRRLADPAPGLLAVGPAHGRPLAWERAARAAVEALYQRAAQPSATPVPPSTEAVLFWDEAELLAQLALDLARAEVADRWWWQALPWRAPTSVGEIARLFCERATVVPAVLDHLAQRWQVGALLRLFAPRQALVILEAVCAAYGIPDLRSRPGFGSEAPLTGRRSESSAQGEQPGAAPGRSAQLAATVAGPAAPWSAWLPSHVLTAESTPESTMLLGVAVGLARQPSQVRSTAFVERVRTWWAGIEVIRSNPDRSVSPLDPAQPPRSAGQAPTAARGRAPRPARSSPSSPPKSLPGPGQPREVDAPPGRGELDRHKQPPGKAAAIEEVGAETGVHPTSDEPNTAAWTPTTPADRSRRRTGSQQTNAARPARSIDAAGTAETVENEGDVRQEFRLRLRNGLRSELGGVFYLLNLMCYLDLPDIFETDWQLASRVRPWGTLELLARGLLQPVHSARRNRKLAAARWQRDELWPTLMILDGREAGMPGANHPGCAAYRLPLDWLRQEAPAETDLRWSSSGSRLRVWTRAGFVVLDEPTGRERPDLTERLAFSKLGPTAQLPSRSDETVPLESVTGSLLKSLNPRLRPWLAAVLPFLRHRLWRALGDDETAAGLVVALLARPAQVYLTATHLDVVMQADTVTLPVRLAGLDRDPGWSPALGRVVKFHFEG